jgi:hypothetical protein
VERQVAQAGVFGIAGAVFAAGAAAVLEFHFGEIPAPQVLVTKQVKR